MSFGENLTSKAFGSVSEWTKDINCFPFLSNKRNRKKKCNKILTLLLCISNRTFWLCLRLTVNWQFGTVYRDNLCIRQSPFNCWLYMEVRRAKLRIGKRKIGHFFPPWLWVAVQLFSSTMATSQMFRHLIPFVFFFFGVYYYYTPGDFKARTGSNRTEAKEGIVVAVYIYI